MNITRNKAAKVKKNTLAPIIGTRVTLAKSVTAFMLTANVLPVPTRALMASGLAVFKNGRACTHHVVVVNVLNNTSHWQTC